MKREKQTKSVVGRYLMVGLVMALSLLPMPRLSAQQTGGSGLSVSPTRHELSIKPGAAETLVITLKNISGVDIIAKAVVNDFEAKSDNGEPQLIVDESRRTPNSIKDFLLDVSDITLKKNETKRLSIPVQIPDSAVSGAYYGVIRYTAQQLNPDETLEKQVALNASIGVIVLIQIPGNITEQIQAVKLTAERDGSAGSFFLSPPDTVAITLKSTGNGFVKPFGRVTINKGSKELYSYEMNNTDPRSNVLPGSTRTFRDEVKDITGFGRYTITANISYGKGGEILTMKSSFWVIPWWLIAVLATLFILLIIVGIICYKFISRRRKRRRR